MTVEVPVNIPEGYFAMGFLYNENTGELEGMPLIAMNSHSVTVAARHFATSTGSVPNTKSALQNRNFYETVTDSGYFVVSAISLEELKKQTDIVSDLDCVNIAHARQKNLPGQNLYDYTDSHGNYVIRDLAAMAQSGGGFVTFFWIKPGETGEKEKLGYVEPIPNTNYFIGSGVYLE